MNELILQDLTNQFASLQSLYYCPSSNLCQMDLILLQDLTNQLDSLQSLFYSPSPNLCEMDQQMLQDLTNQLDSLQSLFYNPTPIISELDKQMIQDLTNLSEWLNVHQLILKSPIKGLIIRDPNGYFMTDTCHFITTFPPSPS